jgi:hypothetical protein
VREPDELTVLWCGEAAQHPSHQWFARDTGGEFWCDGTNADGTSPYDPSRPGYEPEPPPPEPPLGQGDPSTQLDAVARQVKGHVTIHASYGPEAERHPDPDWSCQLVWATGQPEQPVASYYGVGTSMPYAIRHVLTQIAAAIAALDDDPGAPE